MKINEIIKLERKIVIGMIINTKFLRQAINLVDTKYVQSKEARLLINWILQYYRKYKKAPRNNIHDIFMEKLRLKKIHSKQAEVIETILDSLSKESQQIKINIKYLVDQTEMYCKACKLAGYAERVQDELDGGNILEAEHLLTNFKPVENIKTNAVTPLGTVQQIKEAFETTKKPLIKYPGSLGDMINQHMVPEGFVVFLGQNKGGKSFILMDAAFKAAKQGKNVALFQAGDMSQSQMERRQAIYLAKKSDISKYCNPLYIPILDCVYNQMGTCELEDLEEPEQEAVLEGESVKDIRENITAKELMETYTEYEDHVTCFNCLRKKQGYTFTGTIWYRKRGTVNPLTWKDVYHLLKKKSKPILNRIKLITYSSESLTMNKIKAEIDILEKTGFFPHVVIVDYMDLLAPDKDTIHMAPRDQENKKWQRARNVSQEKKCLFLSASQSDAQGFNKMFLAKENFSEDRRKLDHVTAMLGLNMTIEEKRKGLMRINDIASRETEGTNYVYVFHRLQIGRPILGSFY